MGAIFLSAPYLFNRFYVNALNHPQPDIGALGIEGLIRQVQIEVSNSEEQRKKDNIAPMFELKGFEIEISFVVRKSLTHGNTVKYEAFAVDDQIQVGSEKTHRLKLIMDIATEDEGSIPPNISKPPKRINVLGTIPPQKGANE